jgi:hypothetical protein
MSAIQTVQLTTPKGNTLQLVHNADTGLVVVDLIAANEQGGNEFVRMTINEDTMLAHALKPVGKMKRAAAQFKKSP